MKVNVRFIENYIKKNPDNTWKQFKKDTRSKVSDAYFYMIRRRITGVTRPPRKGKTAIFFPVFTAPTQDVNQNPKQVLRNFVSAMNNIYRTKLELIEYDEPAQIEVRERKF